MSGHDEYMYRVLMHNKSTLPLPALYMIRYHSFYPWHKEGGYQELLDDQDKKMLPWIKEVIPAGLSCSASMDHAEFNSLLSSRMVPR